METNKPLSGIKVIELTTAVAAPSCGRILAYLGAEVTKIENVSGDAYRQIYTPYLPSESGDAPVYDTLNSQKKSIAANLKNETVNRYVHELLKDCDVFFSNVRNAGLKKLGLDYETLRETNPGLIYGHFSGYGEGGPLAGLPGYDSTAYLARNGVYRSFIPDKYPPMVHSPGLGDLNCGLALAASLLAALVQRGRTGEGQKVVCALNQVGAWNMFMPFIYSQIPFELIRDDGAPVCLMDASFRCKDGVWIYYSAATEKQWIGLLHALEMDELIEDPRFATSELRRQHTQEVLPLAYKTFEKYTSDEILDRFKTFDVPCEKHRKVADMAQDEQLFANGFLYRKQYTEKEFVMVNPPFTFEGKDLAFYGEAAPKGADTRRLLKSVGCPDEEIEALIASGDICCPEDQDS